MALFSVSCRTKQQDKPVQAAAPAASGHVLDTVITKRIPLTVDGEWATIVYHLKVQDWKKPVEWTFDVIHGNDTVYSVVSDSTETEKDSLFNDFGFVPQTPETTYLGQKTYWYLTGIMTYHSDTIAVDDTIGKRRFQQQCRSEKVASMWLGYRSKPMIWYSFRAGTFSEEDPGAWAYHPKMKKLVCIYAP
ncbi:MAG: hypothetical protein EG825_14255 [Rhodocyclaceae bacterium]|nr:hypothetical protein [Rhodocyclaceae bacterium]